MTGYLFLKWVRQLLQHSKRPTQRVKTASLILTQLEDRITPAYTVAQIRSAYGINSIPDFNSLSGPVTPDGTGQTIAIVDAFDDTSLLSDLDLFDQNMTLTTTSSETLYQQYGAASSFVTVYNEYGVNITSDIGDPGDSNPVVPNTDSGWNGEEALDIEWSHAIAPGAKIDFIECNNSGELDTGESIAASLPGVSAISNSWAGGEYSNENITDSSLFVTPSGHPGITFLASSGDCGAIATGNTPGSAYSYPAVSPNVVAVGGTHLNMNGNNYGSESVWSFPAPAETADYGSASTTGSWTSNSGGFSGTYGTAAKGSSASVSWTLPISGSEQGWSSGTEISVTWTANASNATNAVFSVYDETQGGLLGTYTVDETQAPVGIADNGHQFQELGVVFANSGDTIKVVLDASSANGTVVADAVGAAQAWAGTGGLSQYEDEPAYQESVQTTGYRSTPDVAFIADSNPGVLFYSGGSEGVVGGTSLACPCWAGLIAIADQGRVSEGGATFNSHTDQQETQDALYSLPATDFNTISGGYDGYTPTSSYNFATGLGSPIANLLIPDLVSYDIVPAVDSISPTEGPTAGGQTITITGTNFLDVTAVHFGSTAATDYNVVSPTEITVTVPAHSAGQVNVVVTTLVGNSKTSSFDEYTYVPRPVVSGVSPNSGSMFGGETVTISGTNFTGASAVEFGNVAATSFNVVSSTTITAVVPAEAAGTVDVTVTTPGGTSADNPPADQFTDIPVPLVSAISPSAGPLAGGTLVTITGQNFAGVSGVEFGNVAGTNLTVVNSTTITVVSPSESAGMVDITVTTSDGVSGTSSADEFDYVAPPTVSGVSPNAGPLAGGQTITITGTNLTAATSVLFGGVAAASFAVVNDTTITAVTPAEAAGQVDVTVDTAGGTSMTSGADEYIFVVPPEATSLTPIAGPVAGGQTITITGSGFTNATAVVFGSVEAASYTVVNDTTITAVTPAEAAGLVGVTVTTAGGTTAALQYTFAPIPIVSGVAPAFGPAYGGTTITITGSGFTNATAVAFGSVAAASFTVVNDTTIAAVDSAEGGGTTSLTVDVTVTTAGGTSATSSNDEYTFVPDPTVSGLSITAGPLVGGQTITITGTNLTNATTVAFGSTDSSSIKVLSSTEMTAVVPAGPPGTVDVTVTTQYGGTSLASSADQYNYVAVPVVSTIVPNEGPASGGATVTITGNALTGASTVWFGSVAATSFTVVSDTEITAVAPTEASGQVNITVTTAGGTSLTSAADLYTFIPAPVINYISFTEGSSAGDLQVTLTGSNLGSATAAAFGSTAANIVSHSGLQVVIDTPAEPAGTVPVTVTTAGGTTDAPYEFTFVAVPAITSVSPQGGPLTGKTTVTITGSGFTNANVVDFGSTAAASFSVNSAGTQIAAVAPAESPATVDVTVAVPVGGTSPLTAADQYTFAPVPEVSGISPSSGPLAGGTDVTISGSYLGDAVAVDFGSVAGTIVSDSASEIVAASPGGTAGTVNVTVVTVGGSSATTSSDKFSTSQASPSFSGLSSPTTTYGTASTTISGTLNGNAGGFTIPAGEAVQVTLNGVTQTATLNAGDTFSTSFATANLVAGSPYTLSFSYGGDANYTSAASTNATLTVTPAVPSFSGLSSPTISYGSATTITGTLAVSGGPSVPTGENIQVTLGGITQTAELSAADTFSTTFPASTLGVGSSPYTIGFSYAGDGNFAGVTGSSSLTIKQANPTFSAVAAPVILPNTNETAISGILSVAGGPVVPAGETVAVTLDGTTNDVLVGTGGTFSATFDTSSLAGSDTPYPVSLSYAGDANFTVADGSTSVTVVPVDASASTLSASASTVASSNSIELTVQAVDAAGNAFTSGGLAVAFELNGDTSTDFSTVTDNGNGTYTATFTGGIAGTYAITATIGGQPISATVPVTVTPGQANAAMSFTTLSSTTDPAGTSVTVTLHVCDAAGNPLTTGGLPVQFTLGNTSGGLGQFSAPVIDNHNGTYTATFSGTEAGDNTVIALIGKQAAPPVGIAVTPGQPSLLYSTLALPVSSVQFGGTTTVVLTAMDEFQNPETGLDVGFTITGPGKLGQVVPQDNGTYTATVTGTKDGTVEVAATIDGEPLESGSQSLQVVGSAVSPAKSKVTVTGAPVVARVPTVTAGGTATVTLTAKNAAGQLETAGGLDVAFELTVKNTGQVTFTPAVDNGDGTYTAQLQGYTAGTYSIAAVISEAKGLPPAPAVKVMPTDWTPATSKVTLSATTVKAGTKVTVALQPEDVYGNKVNAKNLTVDFLVGTTPLVGKYQSNGTYTATYTSTLAGNYPVAATINGEVVTSTLPSLTVTPSAANVTKSTLTVTPSTTVALNETLTVTVQAVDAYGNDLTTGGLLVGFALGAGTGKGKFGKVSYAQNGQYTVTFTGTAAGTVTIEATIAGVKLKATQTVTVG